MPQQPNQKPLGKQFLFQNEAIELEDWIFIYLFTAYKVPPNMISREILATGGSSSPREPLQGSADE